MALLKVICWAIIFIARIRFPPGKSLATFLLSVLKFINRPDRMRELDYFVLSEIEMHFLYS